MPSNDAYSRSSYDKVEDISAAADYDSATIDVSKHTSGSVQICWTGFDAFDATVAVEVSNVPSPATDADWAEEDGSCVQFDAASGSRVFKLGKYMDVRWLRISYIANNVSAGTFSWYLILKRDS